MKIGFDCEPVFDQKCFKSKIKSYDDEINTNVHGNRNF